VSTPVTLHYRKRIIALPAVVAAGLILIGVGPVCRTTLAGDASAPSADSGDSTNEVVAKLGTPQGVITRGRLTTYYYDRGMVDFIDGRVKTAFLITPEQVERQRAERERNESLQRQQAEAQRQHLVEEGQRELLAHQADGTFESTPATNRLAYWQSFSRRYPYTDIDSELMKAQTAVEVEATREKQARELQALRDRIAAIQARLTQLDADYAASLANWKRNEIEAERGELKAERETVLGRIDNLQDRDQTSSTKAP
jgi:hypothetical protein